MSLTMACNGLGVIIFCLWVRQQAQSTPSQGQVSVDESYTIIDVSTVDRKQICFVGMGHVTIFRFELCVLCHLYIICIYIWYMIHKYYWPILIDYMFKWCMCFHDVSCADTQRFTAGPNFGWCIPPGEAPLSQGLQPSLLTLSSLTALATFILVYMINMNNTNIIYIYNSTIHIPWHYTNILKHVYIHVQYI